MRSKGTLSQAIFRVVAGLFALALSFGPVAPGQAAGSPVDLPPKQSNTIRPKASPSPQAASALLGTTS